MNEEGMKRGGNSSSNVGFNDACRIGGGDGTGVRYIEHQVSRFDTLAGIAINYGVEVEDIKRMNCLMTDFQMFAHKKVKIPLPRRYQPSQNLSNGSSHNRSNNHIDLQQRFQSLKLKSSRPKVMSPAMANLQGYYGLSGTNTKLNNLHLQPHGNHRKTRSVSGYVSDNEEVIVETNMVADGENNSDVDRFYSENSVRRRQKTDGESSYNNTSGVLSRAKNEAYSSGKTRRNPTPIPKRFGAKADLDLGRQNSTPIGDLITGNRLFSVKKSSSTSNLQESDNSSVWPPTPKWIFNTNLPLFDGLSKPIVPRIQRKTALD